ncbi:ThiF family adenylyltransferase [Geobacter anodireducens]
MLSISVESNVLLEPSYQRGIERLAAFISQFPQHRVLTKSELNKYRIRFSAGWEIYPFLPDPKIQLRLLLTSEFPYSPPRIAVYPAPPILTWPHLENEGLLCLLADGATFSVENIEAVTRALLSDACTLVTACLNGEIDEQFEDEFDSYWLQWPATTKRFQSLCAPGGVTRWVYSSRLRQLRIVADDRKVLESWMLSCWGEDIKGKVHRIPLIRLQRPMRPVEYPETFGKLLQLVETDTEAQLMIQEIVNSDTEERKALIFSFGGRRGHGFAGIVWPAEEKLQKLTKGFRKTHIPQYVLARRYQAIPMKGALVTRCDSSWVHGRDHNPDVPRLVEKTVVLLGAGSLGSGVAELLTKMGIKKLVVVDPDLMATENASRHTLGVASSSLKKATKLIRLLRKRCPHIEFVAYEGPWEYMYQRTPAVFTSADLIISTIGGWKSESMLNSLANSIEGFPPVIYGWLEPHAAAGHAIAFWGGKGCLRCITTELGAARLPVTKWPGSTRFEIPMCGGMFQPYGAIELSYAQGLVADLAADILLSRVNSSVHRTWIGQMKLLESGRGEWNPDWISRHGHPEDGGKIINLTVTADTGCPVCGENR